MMSESTILALILLPSIFSLITLVYPPLKTWVAIWSPPEVSKNSQTIPLANLASGITCLSKVEVRSSLSAKTVSKVSVGILENASSVGANMVNGPSP